MKRKWPPPSTGITNPLGSILTDLQSLSNKACAETAALSSFLAQLLQLEPPQQCPSLVVSTHPLEFLIIPKATTIDAIESSAWTVHPLSSAVTPWDRKSESLQSPPPCQCILIRSVPTSQWDVLTLICHQKLHYGQWPAQRQQSLEWYTYRTNFLLWNCGNYLTLLNSVDSEWTITKLWSLSITNKSGLTFDSQNKTLDTYLYLPWLLLINKNKLTCVSSNLVS